MENRPRGRETNVTGQGKPIEKRGSGLGTGPVGSGSARPQSSSSSSSRPGGSPRPGGPSRPGSAPVRRSSSGTRSAGTRGGGSPLLKIIIGAVVLLGGGGGILGGVLGGGGGSSSGGYSAPSSGYVESGGSSYSGSSSYSGGSSGYTGGGSSASTGSSSSSGSIGSLGSLGSFGNMSSLLGGLNAGTSSSGWSHTANTGKLNTSVAAGARAKRTQIIGNNKDTVTIMVYMCGTDLESKSGMATADLQEMANATIADNVNIIVYTGGCKQWKNTAVSSSVNQIYQVVNGGLKRLEDDMGSPAMVKPATLSDFILWCHDNYPANRNELIFWDHGGGSLSGYGYDEKNPGSGSMTLKGIDQALQTAKNKGVTFDFIGFDACLMATAENALMLTEYADYLIASEETEPGIGWYYTNWLTKLSQNASMSTLEIGKNIADDFVDTCARQCAGQKATLSVIDLAELEATAPSQLTSFAVSTSELMNNSEYQTVSNARSCTREFASSNKLDQVDLVDLAYNMGTSEGEDLATALLNAVKYNRSSMTNAYGLSIYFPQKKLSSVNTAVAAYDAIGMDSEYARCIQQFASIETGGQAVSGGSSTPTGSLLNAGHSTAGTAAASSDMISSLLSGLLGGNMNGVAGLTGSNSGFLGKSLNVEDTAAYLADNRFDADALKWSIGADGRTVLALSEQQWGLVQGLELNVFYDDGYGFIDLGLDNVFDFTDDGALLGEYDGTWLAINDQPVAYYHEDTYDDGENYTITGRVPVLLNGELADLILVFDNENPYGYIAGARYGYKTETETVAKSLTELNIGDTLDFVCDYYGYDGSYQDSYLFGEQMIVSENMVISNVYIDADAASATYRFTDIYQQDYWTPVIP